MAEKMIRKQFRFTQQQMILIKRLAKERGVSESELIRQALERELNLSKQTEQKPKK